MTELLVQAISELKKLPVEAQNAIAYRILAGVESERAWAKSFAETTDEQWKKIIEKVDKNIKAGKTVPLSEVFPDEE